MYCYLVCYICICNGLGINVKYVGFKLSFVNILMVNIKLRKNILLMGVVDI